MLRLLKEIFSKIKPKKAQSKLSLINVLNVPDEELSEDARLIKNYFIRLIRGLPNNVYWVDKNGITLGCNDNVLKFVGVNKLEDVVGKSYEELIKIAGWTVEQGMSFKRDDQEVIRTGKPKLNVIEPVFYDKNGKEIHYVSSRIPLFDDDHNLVGIAGISVDIGDRIEKERLEIENEANKNLLHEHEKFVKIANQVAHDIRSPLASLLMIVKSCTDIPEAERIALREAAIGIGDIANNLLSQYQKSDNIEGGFESRESILVSARLLQLLTDKKYQYQEYPAIRFEHDFSQKGNFAFIKIEPSAFKRMMSNLVNNAVDAFEKKEGIVTLRLDADSEWVWISVDDNGKGMTPELVNKIRNKIQVTEGKKEGHGIGLVQVREALERNQGEISIESEVGKGTKITLTFPRAKASSWIAEEIRLYPNDIVVILDDDSSIHRAWDTHFDSVMDKQFQIQIKHFANGKDAIEFINALSVSDKGRVILLTDYELLKQELNGLHVVEKTGVARSILVTSHYANKLICDQAAKTGTKVLPKQLASEVPIIIDSNINYLTSDKPQLKMPDLVVVDDDLNFANVLINLTFEGLNVDHYASPEDFLKNIAKYPKNVKVCLDKNFANGHMNGIALAEVLHKEGFTRLFMISGEVFAPGVLPDYLTVIDKLEIDKVRDL